MVVTVDVVKVLVGICRVGDVVVRVGGDGDGAEDGVTDVVTEVSCEHKSSYQVEVVVVAGLDLELGFGFAWLSSLDLRNLCGFHLLLLRAALSAGDRVLMSVAPKFGGGSPRASGVIGLGDEEDVDGRESEPAWDGAGGIISTSGAGSGT